jgi:NTE family protein
MLNPLNWFRLWSPRFGRSDMAQEYYDSVIFNGATLGDLVKGKGPLVIPLATDANDGLTFTFTPDQFALICSDFEQFPLSRAVAASGAFPGLFSPIILRNYAGQCDTKVPSWITDALEKPDLTSRTYYHALRTNTYLDPETKPYIHLVDGGVADNLGLRASMDFIAASGGMRDYLREVGFDKTRRVAFIIVDAATQEVPRWRLLDEIPGLATILGVSSSIMINKYNFETIDLFRRYVQDWTDDNAAAGKKPISFYIIHVAFNALPDQKEREYFQNISTTLYLHEDQVDKLRGVAERLLYASGPLQKLVRDLGGKIPEPKPVDDKTSTSKK